jgi:DNA polymerase sigma
VAIDPRVRPLILIIKHWAKQRKLNDAGKKKKLSFFFCGYLVY